jgi:hypothetical protein
VGDGSRCIRWLASLPVIRFDGRCFTGRHAFRELV